MSTVQRFKNRAIAMVATAFPSFGLRLAAAYAPLHSDEVPWAPPRKPLAAATVALVTTAGVHHRDQPPYDMHDPDGDPSFRELSAARPLESLMITHDYYDHADADRDINIVFHVERLRELAAAGEIGRVAGRHYGFMGHITGPHVATLQRKTGPAVAALLKKAGVHAVLLTPG